MRFRGMMVALSLLGQSLAWGCGDDSGGPSDPDTDGSVLGQSDGGAGSGPDARVDGGMVISAADGGPSLDAALPDSGPPDTGMMPCSGAFALQSLSGTAPFFAAVSCSGAASGGATYDWGEGAGPEASGNHRYKTPGTYTVKQQPAGTTLSVTVSSFTPVRFSSTDKTPKLTVSPDGFEVAQSGLDQSAGRSDGSISAGQGIFYFESHRLADSFYRGALGIATAAAELQFYFDPLSKNMQSAVYMLGDGSALVNGVPCNGQPLDPKQADTGYVVDYRGASPILHVLQDVGGTPKVLQTCALAVTTPVFIFFGAERAIVGNELRINTGADTTNSPFHYSDAAVRAAVTAAGSDGASALVMGYGKTNAGRQDSPPALTVPADLSLPLGQSTTLSGSAIDAEDGVLDGQISWVDTALQYDLQTPTIGKSFAFAPDKLGVHKLRVSVADLDGVVSSKTVTVTVTGSLPLPNPVQLVPTAESMAANIDVSPDLLSARFRTNGKFAIRANTGILGSFWYFEVHRNNPIRNMGMGLVTEDGNISPYESEQVPWSCSINVLGSGSAYINLILQSGGGNWESDPPVNADYGFAVDYRGLNPLVYIIIGNKVQTTLKLSDVTVPLYPMLYGNGFGPTDTFDYTANFGASMFNQAPSAALTAAGIDPSGLKVGWGVHAQ